MTPSAYSQLVKDERSALAALTRKLRAWSSKDRPTLVDVAVHWNSWARLAAMLEKAHREQGT
jgi:hypothetical protein